MKQGKNDPGFDVSWETAPFAAAGLQEGGRKTPLSFSGAAVALVHEGPHPYNQPMPSRKLRPLRRNTPTEDERRSIPRVAPHRSARIIDISPRGIQLDTSVPLIREDRCDLLLRVDDRVMPVSGRIVTCRRKDGTTRARIAFERVLESDRQYLEQVLVREVADRITVILR